MLPSLPLAEAGEDRLALVAFRHLAGSFRLAPNFAPHGSRANLRCLRRSLRRYRTNLALARRAANARSVGLRRGSYEYRRYGDHSFCSSNELKVSALFICGLEVKVLIAWFPRNAVLGDWSSGRCGYSRKIVGWALSHRIDGELTLAALRDAITKRKPPRGVFHHSDRGVQYAYGEYVKLLEQN